MRDSAADVLVDAAVRALTVSVRRLPIAPRSAFIAETFDKAPSMTLSAVAALPTVVTSTDETADNWDVAVDEAETKSAVDVAVPLPCKVKALADEKVRSPTMRVESVPPEVRVWAAPAVVTPSVCKPVTDTVCVVAASVVKLLS